MVETFQLCAHTYTMQDLSMENARHNVKNTQKNNNGTYDKYKRNIYKKCL